MDSGLLVQTALGVTSVIDALIVSETFQTPVHLISPCCPPEDKLIFAVPTRRDRILSAVFGAFWILGYPLIALCLRC